MGTVVFIPGLSGQLALRSSATRGINESAVMDAAKDSNWDFQKFDYQSYMSQTPLLSNMEASVGRQLDSLIHKSAGKPIVVVGSSVGFGVLVGALSKLKSSTSPIALLGFKPVPDPLLAIELQINNPKVLADIKSGVIPEVPMPVEGIYNLQDTFMLSAKHLNDKEATRILSHSSHADRFNGAMTSALQSCSIIYGTQDHLTPSAHMQSFTKAVKTPTDIIALEGDHSSDWTKVLYDQTREMVARLG